MPRFRLRTLFGLVTLCAVGSCIFTSFQSRVTYNASRDDVWLRLPKGATRINHFQPVLFGANTFYEFDTSEESFLEWVKGYSNVTRSNHPAPYRIYRYHAYGPDADSSHIVTISSGHLFEWTEEDRGLHIAYNKESGRAYFWSHSR